MEKAEVGREDKQPRGSQNMQKREKHPLGLGGSLVGKVLALHKGFSSLTGIHAKQLSLVAHKCL